MLRFSLGPLVFIKKIYFFFKIIFFHLFCIGFTITLATPDDDAFRVGDGGCSKDCETDSWLVESWFNSWITFSFDFVLIFVWIWWPRKAVLDYDNVSIDFYSLKKKSLCMGCSSVAVTHNYYWWRTVHKNRSKNKSIL